MTTATEFIPGRYYLAYRGEKPTPNSDSYDNFDNAAIQVEVARIYGAAYSIWTMVGNRGTMVTLNDYDRNVYDPYDPENDY